MVFVGVKEGACGLAVAVADRGERPVFEGDKAVRFAFGLGKEIKFGGGEVCFLHEGIKGYGVSHTSGALSVGGHEVPVHDVVVVGTGGDAVADVKNFLEVPAVSLVARHGVGSGHAGEVVGGLAEHVGEAVRVLAAFNGVGYPAVHAGAYQEEGEGNEHEDKGAGEGDEAGGACVLHHVNLRSFLRDAESSSYGMGARSKGNAFRVSYRRKRGPASPWRQDGRQGRSHRFVSHVYRHSHIEKHTSRRA